MRIVKYVNLAPPLRYSLIFLIAFALPLLVNHSIHGPVYQSDEGGYLANALALSGHITDAASHWHSGYSLFLIPAILIGGDPVQIFSYVKLTNALFLGLTAIITLSFLSLSFRDQQTNLHAVTAVIFSIFYPTYVIMVGFAFSTVMFIFFFSLSVYLCARVAQDGHAWWLLFGVVSGFLYWIHPIGSGVIIAAILVGIYIAWRRRELSWLAAMATIIVTLPVSYQLLLKPYVASLMAVGDFTRHSGYPAFLDTLSRLLRTDYSFDILLTFMGQLFYVMSSTYGLILVFFIALLIAWIGGRREIVTFCGACASAYSCLSIIAVAIMSALFLARSQTLQTIVQGRYIDMVVLPLLAFGIYLYSWRALKFCIIVFVIWGLCVVGLTYVAERQIWNFALPDRLGLWQVIKIPYVPGGPFSASLTLFIWLCTVAGLMGLMLAMKKQTLVFATLGVAFSYTVYVHMAKRVEATTYYVDPKYELAKVVNTIRPSGKCVLFDEDGGYINDTPNVYSFYLVGFEFRKLHLTGWGSKCSGVILSRRTYLDQYMDVVPVAFNKYDKLIAWVSKSDYNDYVATQKSQHFAVLGCFPWPCLKKQGFSDTDLTSVGVLEGTELISSGREGFLLYGPYQPFKAGVYDLRLYGSATSTGSAWVDIVSDAGETQHVRLPLQRKEKPDSVLAGGRVTLDEPVDDIEVRVHVGTGDIVRLSGFELRAGTNRALTQAQALRFFGTKPLTGSLTNFLRTPSCVSVNGGEMSAIDCPSGSLIFGPYISVAAGDRIKASYDVASKHGTAVLATAVVSDGGQTTHQESERVTIAEGERHRFEIDFLATEAIAHLEARLRLISGSSTDLTIDNVAFEVERVSVVDLLRTPSCVSVNGGEMSAIGCPSGALIFGPYISVEAGDRIKASYDVASKQGTAVLATDVVTDEGQTTHQRSEHITIAEGERHRFEIDFIATEAIARLEARLHLISGSSTDLTINNVAFEVERDAPVYLPDLTIDNDAFEVERVAPVDLPDLTIDNDAFEVERR